MHVLTTKHVIITPAQKFHKNISEPSFYKSFHRSGKPINLYTCLLFNKGVTH